MVLSITISILLIIQIGCHTISGMHLTDITVPEVVDFRHKIEISCEYNINGKTLHSVKWYKDNMEFFRYAPEMNPRYMNFTVDGIKLADQTFNCDDTQCSVKLEQLRPQTSGVYKCEVSSDAPHFNLISGTANMSVAAISRHDPEITGLSQSYAYGDYIDANCTSDQSNPPSDLTWYIDERKLPIEYLRPQQETAVHIGEFTLFYRTQPLRLKIEKQQFHNGKSFTLKCEATFGRYTHLTRAKSARVFIVSTDDLTNQKLVNSKNAATATAHRSYIETISGFTLIVILLVKHFV